MNIAAVAPDLDLDSVEASVSHAELIRSKLFLRRIYEEHYNFFATEAHTAPEGQLVELGSGGGFLHEIIPNAITSDVVPIPGTALALSAHELPFPAQSLSAIVMINVLHHIQDVEKFFNEASRTLKTGGKVVMVEPANTAFSNFIYSNFHHEPFEPKQKGWKLPPGGRMSSANDALPWIIFCRDRVQFQQQFPELKINLCVNYMPLRYILSGGVSRGQLTPSWSYRLVQGVERCLTPLNNLIGMFMRVVIEKA